MELEQKGDSNNDYNDDENDNEWAQDNPSGIIGIYSSVHVITFLYPFENRTVNIFNYYYLF